MFVGIAVLVGKKDNMNEPMCGACRMWSKPMKIEKWGKNNLFLLKCTNPNHSYSTWVEVANYKFFRRVDVKK